MPKLGRVTYVPGLPGTVENYVAILGGIVTGITAYASLWFMMRYLETHKATPLTPFAYYSWGAGIVAIATLFLT